MRYIPILLSSFKDCFKDLPVDIYLQLGEDRYVKAFDKATGLDFGRLANYEAHGTKYFYVTDQEESALNEFFAKSPMLVLTSPDTTIEQKRCAFWVAMEQSMEEAFTGAQVKELNISKAFIALQIGLEHDKSFHQTFSKLVSLAPKSGELFRHAITTAAYTYILCTLAEMKSPRSLKILLFASIFHDIGKLQLSDDRRRMSGNRTLDELNEFRRHPEFSVGLFTAPLPFGDEEVRKCILHHKERPDGRGYPQGLKGINIYHLAKILSVADAYSELTLGIEDGKRYPPEQAISLMKADPGRFDAKLLSLFSNAVLNTRGSRAA